MTVDALASSDASTIPAPRCENRNAGASFTASPAVGYCAGEPPPSSTSTTERPEPATCGTQYFGCFAVRTQYVGLPLWIPTRIEPSSLAVYVPVASLRCHCQVRPANVPGYASPRWPSKHCSPLMPFAPTVTTCKYHGSVLLGADANAPLSYTLSYCTYVPATGTADGSAIVPNAAIACTGTPAPERFTVRRTQRAR